MTWFRHLLGWGLGGSVGFAVVCFTKREDWGMVALCVAMLFATLSIIAWYPRYKGKE